jgi:UDP-2-acetamido-2-deoxy-ribo-hexuluronate aminotransferase
LRYTKLLNGHPKIVTPFRVGDCNSHVYHQYTLRILEENRDGLVQALNAKKIPYGIYYPVPLHQQKAYVDPKLDTLTFPVTNQLVNEVISLPMHSELSVDQIEYICYELLDFLDKS